MRIVFFGTPDFAVPSLKALVEEGFDVRAVVTQPDRPKGRSRSKTIAPPVKVEALEEDLPVLQPEDPNAPGFLNELTSFEVDLGVVVAYGHILRPVLLDYPEDGMINVHASLLPELRGAAPIQHAIMGGLKATGISIMRMDEGMDSGPVLHRVEVPVAPDETGGELSQKLSEIGALALIEALSLIATGSVEAEPQDDSKATFAPKIDRKITRIDWRQPADAVARLIRAMDPTPGAWAELESAPVKLYGATVEPELKDYEPGTVVSVGSSLTVACGRRAVSVLDVQPAGKRRMTAEAWCRGGGPSPGVVLG